MDHRESYPEALSGQRAPAEEVAEKLFRLRIQVKRHIDMKLSIIYATGVTRRSFATTLHLAGCLTGRVSVPAGSVSSNDRFLTLFRMAQCLSNHIV
jgi:hypothetical protein